MCFCMHKNLFTLPGRANPHSPFNRTIPLFEPLKTILKTTHATQIARFRKTKGYDYCPGFEG